MTLTPELCHAARILAHIDREALAHESGLAEDKIAEFENGRRGEEIELPGVLGRRERYHPVVDLILS